jgi:hypothetical protein
VDNLQRLIDEIRFRLQSQDCEFTDDLRQIATDYVAVCHDVNRRLRRCGVHLKQGLRAEAIHLAESEPRLLDVVATVDFPERGEWEEVLGVYQVVRPEPLLLDVAEQLNEAYALQRPLEKLLDRHRLLALCRAPLGQRLAVLRQLAKVDTASTVWEDDLRAFEKARAGEIAAQAQSASDHGDREALEKLRDELAGDEWREPPAKDLVQSVKRLAAETTRSTARAGLATLEGEMNAAFSALDLAQCRSLRDKWNELAERAQLEPDDRLLEQVGPALGWLADEDARDAAERAFKRAAGALERALADRTADAEELRQAGHAVLKCGRGMPELLQSRYHDRVRAVESAAQRHQRLVLGSALGGTVLVIGLLGVMVYRNYRAGVAQRIGDSVVQLVREDNLAEARKLVEANTGLSSSGPWLAAERTLVQAEQSERARINSLQAALDSARDAARLPHAEPYLNEARRLARTPEEKRELARLETQLQTVERQETASYEKQFRERLDALAQRVAELDRTHATGIFGDEFAKRTAEMEGEAADLRRLAASVDRRLTDELKVLESRLSSHKQAIASAARKTELLDRLTKSSFVHPGLPTADRNLSDFSATLRAYCDAFPGDARTRDFEAVAREAECWQGVIAWERLLDRWNDWEPHDTMTAKSRIDDCQNWLKAHGDSPTAEVARRYLAWLQSVVLRDEGPAGDRDAGLRARFMMLFTGPLIDGVYCVETNAGLRYYVSGEEDFSRKRTIRFSYLVGFAGETKSKTTQSTDLKFDHARPAPQSELAKNVRGRLPVVRFEGWDAYVRELAVSILHEKRLDPCLRHFLLSRTLEYAAAGNSLLGPELQGIMTKLRDDKIDLAAKWMDPDDAGARGIRQRAERALGLIEEHELAEAWERASQREKDLAASMRSNLMIVGWLSREGASGWVCRTAWTPRGDHRLQIAVPNLSGRATAWAVVGSAGPERGIVIERAHAPDFREGRPIFAADTSRRPAAEK